MKDKIESILSEAQARIAGAADENELQKVRSDVVGKQGSLTLLLKELPNVEASQRPEMGKLLNQAKNQVTELIDGKRTELKLKASEVMAGKPVRIHALTGRMVLREIQLIERIQLACDVVLLINLKSHGAKRVIEVVAHLRNRMKSSVHRHNARYAAVEIRRNLGCL